MPGSPRRPKSTVPLGLVQAGIGGRDMVSLQVCPFHTSEDIPGELISGLG